MFGIYSMKKTWLIVALVNLLLAASLGALLRFAFVEEIKWLQFKNFLHAHSHVAMLGWVYLALYNLLIHQFLPKEKQVLSTYRWLFWITQISIGGMLISFPLQGYGSVSITFSTLHILCSYLFVRWFWRDLNKKRLASYTLVLTSLFFMLFSTLGVWAIGPLTVAGLKSSVFYYLAIQFYLHFQFNGWFIFAVLGIFFKKLEDNGIVFALEKFRTFYLVLLLSCPLTYALAVAWANPLGLVFLVNRIGVVSQLLAGILLFRMVWEQQDAILQLWQRAERTLIFVSFYSFLFKLLVQALVVIPFIAEAAYTIRNYVIGFIHLIMLGTISSFLLAQAADKGILKMENRLTRLGIGSFIAGFLLSESILFLQGTMLWVAKGFLPMYYEVLFGASFLIPFGVSCLLGGMFQKYQTQPAP